MARFFRGTVGPHHRRAVDQDRVPSPLHNLRGSGLRYVCHDSSHGGWLSEYPLSEGRFRGEGSWALDRACKVNILKH